MGTPKGNQKGFALFPSGGVFADSGAGVVQTAGCDAKNDQVRVWGRFTVDAVPAATDVTGQGISGVVRDAQGIFTVTFDEGFQAMQYGNCILQHAAGATDTVGQVSTFTAGVAGACTLRLLVFTGAAAADPAVGDYVCFDAVLTSQWLDS